MRTAARQRLDHAGGDWRGAVRRRDRAGGPQQTGWSGRSSAVELTALQRHAGNRATTGVIQRQGWDEVEFGPGDRVFGPSGDDTAGGYSQAAKQIGKARKGAEGFAKDDYGTSTADPEGKHALTMGAHISAVANTGDVEEQWQTGSPFDPDHERFESFYENWLGEKAKRARPKKNPYARPSKAALEFTRSKGKRVHFVLPSSMDWGSAAAKVDDKSTGHELRYLARNRGQFKGNVTFYDEKGNVRDAPWNESETAEAWRGKLRLD